MEEVLFVSDRSDPLTRANEASSTIHNLIVLIDCYVPTLSSTSSSTSSVAQHTYPISRNGKVAFRNKSCGGGQVVSVLAFHTEDPSSNPAEAYSIFCAICV